MTGWLLLALIWAGLLAWWHVLARADAAVRRVRQRQQVLR